MTVKQSIKPSVEAFGVWDAECTAHTPMQPARIQG